MGPELQLVGSVEGMRTSFLIGLFILLSPFFREISAFFRFFIIIASDMMLNSSDSIIQAEAISCLQQLHLFTPRHVHLDRLVVRLCVSFPFFIHDFFLILHR